MFEKRERERDRQTDRQTDSTQTHQFLFPKADKLVETLLRC